MKTPTTWAYVALLLCSFYCHNLTFGADTTSLTEATLHRYALDTMKELSAKYWERVRSEDPERIKSGYWYSTDHLVASRAVLDEDHEEHLEMRNKLAYLVGFVDEDAPLKFRKQYESLRYVLKEGSTPTDALDWILQEKGLIIIDCGIAVELAYYTAIRKATNNDKVFNRKFQKKFLLSAYMDETVFSYLQEYKFRKPTEVKSGHFVHFTNSKKYSPKHPLNHFKGMNCIVSTDTSRPTFFGLGLPPQGITEPEMCQLLADEYNKKPLPSEWYYPADKSEVGKSYRLSVLPVATFNIEKKIDANQVAAENRTEDGLQHLKILSLGLLKQFNVIQTASTKATPEVKAH